MINDGLVNQKGVFLGNPLRFLDCTAESSNADIHRAYNEISRIRLRADDTYELKHDPFSKIDPILIDRSNAQHAFELLRDPIICAVSKILYPSQKSDEQIDVIKLLQKGSYKKIISFGSHMKTVGADSAVAIAEYVVLFYSTRKLQNIETLRQPLWKFGTLLSDKRIRKFAALDGNKNIKTLDEHQVSETAWKFLLFDYWSRSFEKVESGDLDFASNMIGAIWRILEDNSVLPISNQVVSGILESHSAKHIKPLIDSLKEHLHQIKTIDSKTNYSKYTKGIIKDVNQRLKVPTNLNKVYAGRFSQQLTYEFDDLAGALRDYAIAINNEWDDYDNSIQFVQLARRYANSPDLKERIEEDYSIIQRNQKIAQQNKTSVGFLETAANYLERNWGRIAVLMILPIALAVGLIKGCENNNKQYTAKGSLSQNNFQSGERPLQEENHVPSNAWKLPPELRWMESSQEERRTPSESYLLKQLAEIGNNKSRLSALEIQIIALDEKLDESQVTLEEMENELQHFVDLHEAGAGNYVVRYELLSGRYELAINAHNDNVEKRKELYQEYNILFDKTNAKIEKYNAASGQ